ncbi:MAG: response regulator [Candidatus Omnitrophota bacterium]
MIKMLVVDDEAGVCDVIRKTFTYIGFSVFAATTAKKALAIIEKEHPQIVFLDILMPDVDGIELLKEIKARYSDLIVIMVTAKQDRETREAAIAAGADGFITKPFSRNYLRDAVVHKIGDVLNRKGRMQIPSLLLVDDEEEFRKTMRDFIGRRYECVIDEASEGAQAVDQVQRLKPDIILLDIKMPGLSGIDVITRIKDISPSSKVIVISAWKSGEVVSQAVGMGAADYISKPVSLTAFDEKLKTLLISLGKLREKTSH